MDTRVLALGTAARNNGDDLFPQGPVNKQPTVKERWLFTIITIPSVTSRGPWHRRKETKGQRARLRPKTRAANSSGLRGAPGSSPLRNLRGSPRASFCHSSAFQGHSVAAPGSPHREAGRGPGPPNLLPLERQVMPTWADMRARTRATGDCPRPAKVMQAEEHAS